MKLTLADTTSGYDLTPLNNNFNALEQELQNKVLYRDNPDGEPNQMENDLDMNGFNIANVALVNGEDLSNLSGNLTLVAGLNDEINTVAGIASDVQTVAGISTDVQTVSADSVNVGTVATNISDVNTVAANTTDIQTLAANVTDVNLVGANISDVVSFADLYLGSKTADPTVDNNGDPLLDGALYFNTVANGGNGELRIYKLTGGVWEVAAFSATAANGVSYNNGTSGLDSTNVQGALDQIGVSNVGQVPSVLTADLNNVGTVSFGYWNDTTANNPLDGEVGTFDGTWMQIQGNDPLKGFQIAHEMTLDSTYIRNLYGTWGPWTQLPERSEITTLQTTKPDYQTETVTINDGAFSSNSWVLRMTKIGNVVTLTNASTITHPSLSVASSGTGAVPAAYRPTTNAATTDFQVSTTRTENIQVSPSGQITIRHYDPASGGLITGTSLGGQFMLTYSVS